jgi:hypothetical protein
MTVGNPCAKEGQAFLPEDAAAWFRWRRLKARLRQAIQTAIEAHAPLGYEDEAGFHFGVETHPYLSSWSI